MPILALPTTRGHSLTAAGNAQCACLGAGACGFGGQEAVAQPFLAAGTVQHLSEVSWGVQVAASIHSKPRRCRATKTELPAHDLGGGGAVGAGLAQPCPLARPELRLHMALCGRGPPRQAQLPTQLHSACERASRQAG